MKKIIGLRHADEQHWVGDGSPVRTLFSYRSMGEQLSPFLMLDYASPATFPPSTKANGGGPIRAAGLRQSRLSLMGSLGTKTRQVIAASLAGSTDLEASG